MPPWWEYRGTWGIQIERQSINSNGKINMQLRKWITRMRSSYSWWWEWLTLKIQDSKMQKFSFWRSFAAFRIMNLSIVWINMKSLKAKISNVRTFSCTFSDDNWNISFDVSISTLLNFCGESHDYQNDQSFCGQNSHLWFDNLKRIQMFLILWLKFKYG
jgi:hypothetical protein